MPVAATSTLNDQNRFGSSYDAAAEEEDIEYNNRWYHGRSSSPSHPHNVSNGVIHQSSSATIGSWGFDVNRSANGQTPSSFTSNNNNNNNDHRTITRTSRRIDELTEDYNDRLVDRSTPPQRFKLRTPTLPRHRDANEFAVVDRLVLGPSRVVQSDYYPTNESPHQQYMSPATRSRQSSTRSILRRRSKSIGDFITPTTNTSPPPPPHHPPHLTQSYQQQYQYHERPRISPTHHHRTSAEHELMAWQNRMLERFVVNANKLIYYIRDKYNHFKLNKLYQNKSSKQNFIFSSRDHRVGNNQITRPPSYHPGWTPSPRMSSKRGGVSISLFRSLSLSPND